MNERKHRKKKKAVSSYYDVLLQKEIGIAYLSFTDKSVLKTSKWHHSSGKT